MTQPVDSNQRALFKRGTLIKKLSSVVARLPQLDLPATIRAIHAFGGVLRDKERLHDVDAICLYSQTPEQSERWAKFRENFNNVSWHGKRSPIGELWDLLKPYYERELSLAKAVECEELSRPLAARGVEPQWAGCFSWTEVLHNPLGVFFPYIEKVLQRQLLKGVKGLSLIFIQYDEFMQGRSGYSHLNSVLAWTPEKPDINSNLLGRTPEEKKELILKELGMFSDLISESKVRYTDIKSKLRQVPIKLNFEALERRHSEISYSAQESYTELLTRAEQARNEMRRYEEEIAVLTTINLAVSRVAEEKEEPKLENLVEEQVAWLTLSWQPKYLVKEARVRELLQILGLPENRVKTLKSPGSKTDYELINMRFRGP